MTNNMTNNSKPSFLSQTNAQMIWELLQETDVYNNTEYQDKIEIRGAFTKNMYAFYEKHGAMDLMECNKLFIGTILNSGVKPHQEKRALFPTTKDIQTERQQQFEKGLSARRQDFENTITASKPNMPNFSDKVDEPIEQMEALISKTIASRNYEIEQIHREMSSRTEQRQPSSFKQIKIDKEEVYNDVKPNKEVDDIVDLNIVFDSVITNNIATNNIATNNIITNNPITKKVTLNESQNRIHIFIDEEPNKTVVNEHPMSKFKMLPVDPTNDGKPVDDDNNNARLFSKMEELNWKLDYIIRKLNHLSPGPAPDDQNHPRGQSNTQRV